MYSYKKSNSSRKFSRRCQIALGKRLAKTIIGDPSVEGVRMGPLAGNLRKDEVTEKV